MGKRNIYKEISQGFEDLKAWRRAELKLKTHVVELPKPACPVKRKVSRSTTDRRCVKKVVAPSVPHEPWLIERLKNPKMAAAYLEVAIEDGDQGALMMALRHVAQAQGGVSEIARRSHLGREATYRMLSKTGNPELRSFTAILAGTGLRLSVRSTESRVKKAA